MPQNPPYSSAWRRGLAQIGFVPNGQPDWDPSSGTTPQVYPQRHLTSGFEWGGYTLFNQSNNFFRNAADVLLIDEKTGVPPPTVTLKTKHAVQVSLRPLQCRHGQPLFTPYQCFRHSEGILCAF